MAEIIRYGVISDTHGSLHPRVFEVFEGVRRIYHCGDIGSMSCVTDLQTIAALQAVHGNMDFWPLAGRFPETVVDQAEFGRVAICHGTRFTHSNARIVAGLQGLFALESPRLVLFGHSHSAMIEQIGPTLFVNPGSASMTRPGDGPSVALVEYAPDGDRLSAVIILLD